MRSCKLCDQPVIADDADDLVCTSCTSNLIDQWGYPTEDAITDALLFGDGLISSMELDMGGLS